MLRFKFIHRVIGLALMLALVTGIVPTLAQNTNPASISITGSVEAINGTTVVVSGVSVDLSSANVDLSNLQVGLVIQVSGTFTNGIIVATTLIIVDSDATPEATAEPDDTEVVTPTPNPSGSDGPIIVIEGPVTTINVNIITIYNITVSVALDNPILSVVNIGDIVRVEGEQDGTGIIIATVVTLTTASVSVNGQVTAINGNIVIINGTTVQFDPDDDVLGLIKIGDILNVDGNYQGNGTTLIFIVINVTIVNNITINTNLPSNCKVSKNGHVKCSKKSH
ncbi:MAG: DUF5666 domain-containing protein [Anaerolineae bacterium]